MKYSAAIAMLIAAFLVSVVLAAIWLFARYQDWVTQTPYRAHSVVVTDNTSLWALFLLGITTGFLLAVCAWLPLYRKGIRDGHAQHANEILHDAPRKSFGRNAINAAALELYGPSQIYNPDVVKRALEAAEVER